MLRWVADSQTGWRWVLNDNRTTFRYEGKVYSWGNYIFEAWHAESNYFQRFSTMKEAAEWLVKKVTSGTGAQPAKKAV
jgi:hypothetical protein